MDGFGDGDLVRYVPLDPDEEGACDGEDDLGVGVVQEGAFFGWLVDFVDTVGLLWCAEEELELVAVPGQVTSARAVPLTSSEARIPGVFRRAWRAPGYLAGEERHPAGRGRQVVPPH